MGRLNAPACSVCSYLTYWSFRPDRIHESEALAGHRYSPYEDVPLEAGNPGSRSGIG
jgi:hypothetical protein